MSDVIFHIRYTARQGSEELSAAAASNAKPKAGVKAGVRVFDARTEFGDAWYQFKNPETGQKPALTLAVRDAHFPFPPPDLSVLITSIQVIAAVHSPGPLKLKVTLGTQKDSDYSLDIGSGPGNLRSQEKTLTAGQEAGDILISVNAADAASVQELLLLCGYDWKDKTVNVGP